MNINRLLIFIFLLLFTTPSLMADDKEVNKKLQAALFVKLLRFNKALKGDIVIYVLKDKAFSEALQKALGRKFGSVTIKEIKHGDTLPTTKPNVLYIGKGADYEKALAYTKSKGIMSITGTAELVKKGVSLGLLKADDGTAKILIGLKGSKAEGISWLPTIFRIARKIK